MGPVTTSCICVSRYLFIRPQSTFYTFNYFNRLQCSCHNRVAIVPRTHSVPYVHARACMSIRGRRQTHTQQRARVSSYSFQRKSGSRSGCQRCSAAAGCTHTCTRSPHRGSPVSLTDVHSVSAYFTLAVPDGGSHP